MSADTDMVENAARAIRNRAEQPIDMAEARYLASAALDASWIGELVEALTSARKTFARLHMIAGDGTAVALQADAEIGAIDAALARARATQEKSS
jgi:hypothetical protein